MASVNSSSSHLLDAFGGLASGVGHRAVRQLLGPLMSGLGMGGGPKFEAKLAASDGPLADAIKQIRGFSDTVIPDAQNIGNEIAGKAPAQYQQIMDQISKGLGDVGNATDLIHGNSDFLTGIEKNVSDNMGYANQAVQDTFDPTRQSSQYQQASDRLMPQLNASLAARGLNDSGAAGAATEKAQSDLDYNFTQNQDQNRQAALTGVDNLANTGTSAAGAQTGNAATLGSLGQTGASIAGMGNDALSNLSTLLQSKYNIPMAASGQLLSMLTAGLTPGIQMAQAAAPVSGSSSKGTSVL